MDLYKIAASNLKGIGRRKLIQLSNESIGLKALFEDDIDALADRIKIKRELLKNMNRKKALMLAEEQLNFNQKYGIQTLYHEDENYPFLLKECADAPITLFYKGNISLNKKTISIVGTRSATTYGKENVEYLISKIKDQDITVASGLAYGIDTYVHECCLKYNVPTIGVLGHGHNIIYPSSNSRLAKQMCNNGGLLTEFGIDSTISKYSFPKRNRIIAGISEVTVVVESPEKGGSIITADLANSYNREVMAIPGPVFSISSKGCNHLIKNQKAHLMSDIGDLFRLMNWEENEQTKTAVFKLSKQESFVVSLMKKEGEVHFDKLIQQTAFTVSYLQSIILDLELKQVLNSLPGSRFKLNHKMSL